MRIQELFAFAFKLKTYDDEGGLKTSNALELEFMTTNTARDHLVYTATDTGLLHLGGNGSEPCAFSYSSGSPAPGSQVCQLSKMWTRNWAHHQLLQSVTLLNFAK
ncbi:hypothetical protein KY285_024650 [Solanum tuberosum]|nr:hypothetical protein KY285_024650 [Solanum tuberosum]